MTKILLITIFILSIAFHAYEKNKRNYALANELTTQEMLKQGWISQDELTQGRHDAYSTKVLDYTSTNNDSMLKQSWINPNTLNKELNYAYSTEILEYTSIDDSVYIKAKAIYKDTENQYQCKLIYIYYNLDKENTPKFSTHSKCK